MSFKTSAPSVSAKNTKRPRSSTPRTLRTTEEMIERLYRTLVSQIDRGHLVPARRTCDKILRLEPNDTDALHTRLFLLLHTDQYTQALDSVQREDRRFEQAYSLYRLQREGDALDIVNTLPPSRGSLILQAQLKYRQGAYQDAIDIYSDLLDSGEPGSEESSDIHTNLQACQKHLDFITTGYMQGIDGLTASVSSSLELSAPPAAPSTSSHVTIAAAALVTVDVPAKVKTVRLSRVPKGVVPGVGPPPDPERWMKKSERSNFGKKRRGGGSGTTGFGTQGAASVEIARASTPVPEVKGPVKGGKNKKRK